MVIAATNKKLTELVEHQRFRLDLYYRLNSFTIHIPPLRERKEDIFALTHHFLKKYNHAYGTQKRISSITFERFQEYSFPGNVRELKNVIKKAVVLSEGSKIDDQVLNYLASCDRSSLRVTRCSGIQHDKTLEYQLADLEKDILVDAIHRHKTTRKIATYLGISQSSVMRKLKKYGLKVIGGNK